jgi:hypothetical protein
MLDQFFARLRAELEQQGYQIGNPAGVPGVPATLYAFSPRRFRLAFALVEDHFLFVDWQSAVPDGLDKLRDWYARLSALVNQSFPVPHALRMQIPNLAIVAVSRHPFPPELAQFVRGHTLTPWYGGETGQIILVDLGNQEVIVQITSTPRQHPIPGALPLNHAVDVIRSACQAGFADMNGRG